MFFTFDMRKLGQGQKCVTRGTGGDSFLFLPSPSPSYYSFPLIPIFAPAKKQKRPPMCRKASKCLPCRLNWNCQRSQGSKPKKPSLSQWGGGGGGMDISTITPNMKLLQVVLLSRDQNIGKQTNLWRSLFLHQI